MFKFFLTVVAILFSVCSSGYAQWQFVKNFPNDDFKGSQGCHGLAVDRDGKIWIQIFDKAFHLIGTAIDTSKGFSRSFEVAKDGNTIYWAGFNNHAVYKYTRPDEFSPFGSVPDTFNAPNNPLERPRAIAFSVGGDTAYVGCFGSSNYPPIQMFVRQGTRRQITLALADTLQGSPGRIIDVPVTLTLNGNSAAALGATIKAASKILSFTGFKPGAIIPGERFQANAPTPDSVIMAFTDFGGGPIRQDGVLVTLQFRISPQAEAGTMAKLDFRQVFASDPQFNGLLIRAVPSQVKIVLQPVTFSIADTLRGAPGDTIAVPVQLARGEQPIDALGAVIKAKNDLLAFVGFVPGPIIPGATLNVHAPAPDSIRLGYINFGGGPLVTDGVLVTLKFRIKPSANNGAGAVLAFSNLTATDPVFRTLPVQSRPGKVTVVIQPTQIGGIKWNDLNGDGRRDANEPGIKGWTINLTGAATLSTTTDSLGNYRFTQLAPGNYTVAEVLQTGWQQTFPPAPGTHTVALRPGEMSENLNFGNWMPGSLQGLLWHDRNRNGKKDPGESSLADWQINLTGAATRSTKTDTAGNYRFENLGPGTYKVSEVLKPRWRQTFPAAPDTAYVVVLAAGQAVRDLNFANEPPVSVDQKDEAPVPEDFALLQNYPNPFSAHGIFDNPSTTIKYAVPRQSLVKIEVFNTLGVRVAVLVNKIHQPGRYAVKLERLDLPGGLYIYKLTAPGWVATRKMLLLK